MIDFLQYFISFSLGFLTCLSLKILKKRRFKGLKNRFLVPNKSSGTLNPRIYEK